MANDREKELEYQRELARLKARRDWEAYERKEREYAKWHRETFDKLPWLRK